MTVSIVPYGNQSAQSLRAICNAHIPLSFIDKLSGGAIKKLAHIGITTFEELHLSDKNKIRDSIKNRGLRKEIFEAKQKIDSRAKVKKLVIEFEYFARNKNIRIRPEQRAMLIGVSLFKEIITNLEQVINLLLETKERDVPFREQETRKKLAETCMHAIVRKAA